MEVRSSLLFLFFVYAVCSFSPPQITSDVIIQSDDIVGDFIELKEGDVISLQCTHPQGEGPFPLVSYEYFVTDVHFVFPDLSEHKFFNPSDYALRRSEGSNDYADSFIIKDAKVTDTGLYACVVRNEPSIVHQVYVFIAGPKLFVPLEAGGYSVDPYNYIVPCKSSRNVPRSSIALTVNGEHWKAASKKYDPRFGFNITEKVAEYKLTTQLMFTCIYPAGNETMEFFIGPRADTSGQKIELEWGEISQWTYVGGELAVECSLKGSLGFEKYKHKINMTCPRCGQTTVSSQTRTRTRGMAFSISIQNVTNEDRGQYLCNWYFDDKLQKSLEKSIEVSPKKGQIKFNKVSPTEVVVKTGEIFVLHVNLTAYPLSLPGFSAKWMRHYIQPPKEAPITETIITDSTHLQESKQFENQVTETLTVREAKTNSSGIYVLSIQILDTVKTVEFKVSVLSDQNLKPKIRLTTPESYVIFDQIYYAPGTQIGILCSAESIPLPSMVRLSYRLINNPVQFIPVPPYSMLYVNGTYESAIQWDTVINQTMDVKCEARWEGAHGTSFELMRIKVADGEPKITHSVTKSDLATPLEDGKDIYDGDSVVLNCTYPKAADWSVSWKFNGVDLPSYKVSLFESDVSNTLQANLRNISFTASGEYSCVLKNNQEKILKLILNVLKTLKPYYTNSDSETPAELQFGQEASLQCHLEGLPKPQIYWYKDEALYTQGVLKEHNRTLYIPRVALEDRGKFICKAVNRAGDAEATFHTTVSGGPKKTSKLWIPLMSIIVLVLICCLLTFIVVIIKQRRTNREQNRALEVLYDQLMRETSAPPPTLKQPLDQRISDLPYNRDYELERETLTIGNRIGTGQFGQVMSGVLKRSRVSDHSCEEEKMPVAVKAPLNGKNPTHQKMLAEELKIMCAIGKHPNILALVGAITKNMKGGELFVVVELCENGNLKEFLMQRRAKFIDELRPPERGEDDYVMPDSAKKSRYASEVDEQWGEEAEKDRLLPDSKSLTTSDLLSYAMQVANGMEYLSGMPCIHRDLAARNILITSNFVCRIADFGMARNEIKDYYKLRKTKNVPVPYRWMSIEAIEQGMFTVESDMWSFGILLYEIFTLSGMPYPTIANEDLLDKLKTGYRNPKPNYCHEEIYQLMQQCWQEEAAKRPTFNHCVHLLKNHLERSSPMLLERVERSIMEDVAKQNNLSKWILQDADYRDQARHALARQEASRAANGENIYLHSY